MKRDIDRISADAFDVLIVGGGIVGAGAARDAALRGLRVALIDQGDFGSGTSSRSSKLVHGGLRYLEHGQLRLVREACRERDILLRLAPHLVRPLPILFPAYRRRGRPLWEIRLGLAIYDALAGDRRIERHRMITPAQIETLEPALERRHLAGGGIYYDCRMNDARLNFENVSAAVLHGAAAANYVRLIQFLKSNGRVAGAAVEDLETGKSFEVRARVVINVTGPWADRIRRLDDPAAAPLGRTTKGIHLILPRLTRGMGLALTAQSDGRLFFVLPFDEHHSLVGTTDTDSEEDPGIPAIDTGDVEYLLSEVQAHFPQSRISKSEVRGAFAGLRTLISRRGAPSDVSREYKLLESPSGLISVIGGKFTTYRVMAARLVDLALRRLGRDRIPCTTDQPLPSSPRAPMDIYLSDFERKWPGHSGLVGRHGLRAEEILSSGKNEKVFGLKEMIAGSGVLWAEALHSVRREMARTPMDFLRRRSTLCLIYRPDTNLLKKLGELFQQNLGWNSEKTEREVAQAQAEWTRHHPC